jgi:tetratricopeptide (TPR) repeat protein
MIAIRAVKEHTYLLALTALFLFIGAFTARWVFDEYLDVRGGSDSRSEVAAGTSSTDRLISGLQGQIQSRPADSNAYAQLGSAYLQKARESGDPSYYGKAEIAFQEAVALAPESFEVMAGLGSLALTRHEFAEGLMWGERAREINPHSAAVLGLIGDAQIELGRYDEAMATFQSMVDLRPDFNSYARIGYARELFGDTDGAIQALKLAAGAGSGFAENQAWLHVQMGHLYFNTGDTESAAVQYAEALRIFPGYVHGLAGQARLEAAHRNYEEAIALYEQAVEKVPVPEYIGALGDLHLALGQTPEAERWFELVGAVQQLYAANGANTDLELALFFADHDRNVVEALAQARLEYERRPSIQVASVLAWTLYKSGRYEEALPYAKESLRLGTQDPQVLFRAGMVYKAVGENQRAIEHLERALELNPQFSVLHAQTATRTLEELRQHEP